MKTLSRWNFRSIVGKVMLGFVVSTMIGSINIPSSFGDNDHNRGKKYNNGRHQGGRGYDNRNRYVHDNRRAYRSYGNRDRVYVPPPVYYEPPPQPGIGIFFPPIYINP